MSLQAFNIRKIQPIFTQGGSSPLPS